MVNPRKSTFTEISTRTIGESGLQNTNDFFSQHKNQFNNSNLLKYPSDLAENGKEAVILFDIVHPVRLFGGGEAKALETIALYLPATLRVSYGAEYEEISAEVKKIASAGAASVDLYDLIRSGEENLAERFGRSIVSGGARMGGSVIDAVTGADFRRQAEIQTGTIVNPHMAVAFTGVPFRKFQFAFQMMARNSSESFTIREIVRRFKQAMHPKIGGGAAAGKVDGRYWEYPYNFRIRLYAPVSGELFMFKIKVCALTSMDVDYAGSGVPSFFKMTGAPVDIRLTLSFQELTVLTREDFSGDQNH